MNSKKGITYHSYTHSTFFDISLQPTVAAPITIPDINLEIGQGEGEPQEYVNNIKLLILLTILTLIPSFIILVTSFTRIIVILY